ncbi:hypothetical protein AUK40_02765 [Candidatus Wirthbacteria bacterium CG2_30_54_11]|uniref:N-(5'-phosphoribosyl)anthranilate isomerase n=1 Tax=Candidatus Wirthbacteria bacterium CG2_30_54_11 TaxID=1817892 RepID=A0A1J5IWV6_9BACT|nr:MAG: hypothetical protein AUK40_02765 [Candidatus Wirthbacteria bacterium CG2_30_54_11]
MTRIKICGIRDLAIARYCLETRIDYLGFILSRPETPRFLTIEQAASLTTAIKSTSDQQTNTRLVGVFVDEPSSFVQNAITLCHLDAVQLHGHEPPDYCQRLRDEGIEVWKAIPLKDQLSVNEMEPYLGVVDVLHLDAFHPTKRSGGLGLPLDLALAQKAALFGKPLALSGGLTSQNVREAIELIRPAIVDVSSGVEIAPGIKDSTLISDFIDQVRSAA